MSSSVSTSISVNSGTAKRPCWACARRRWKCDGAEPYCAKCLKNGITCPGYADSKPLRWLAPGAVLSRARRKPAKPNVDNEEQNNADNNTDAEVDVETRCVYEKWIHPEGKWPIDGTGRYSLRVMIDFKYSTDGPLNVLEACTYYNDVVHRPYSNARQLASQNSAFLAQLPLEVVRWIPESMGQSLVYMTIGHRLAQIGPNADLGSEKQLQAKMYHFRGLAIKSLNQEIVKANGQSTDAVINNISMLLFGELRQAASPTWIQHVAGLALMVKMRGGIAKLIKERPTMQGVFIYVFLIAMLGNTVTRPLEQMDLVRSDDEHAILELYPSTGIIPVLFCPAMMLPIIIAINRLRAQAAESIGEDLTSITGAASELLDTLVTFNPETWAHDVALNGEKDTVEADIAILGRIWQSCVIIFCIASLKDHFVPVLVRSHRKKHAASLLEAMRTAMQSARLKLWLPWPLTVLGVELINDKSSEQSENRAFVKDELTKMSVNLGSPLPIIARDALELYWMRGKDAWDECFETPFAFIT